MSDEKKHIVIVGAGFGGIKLAKMFAREDVKVTIIDRHNFHLFQPLLYQVSTAILSEDEIAYPIRAFFRKNKNVELFMAKAQGVTEQLKADDMLKWVGLMNNIRACAEEVVMNDLIYA